MFTHSQKNDYYARYLTTTFDYADETTLRFEGFYFKDKDGWITFLRGEAEPGF